MKPNGGATIVLQPEGIRIVPAVLADIEAFRAWVRSDEFPEKGRIDWIGGEVDVDMSPEDLFTHGTAKGAIGGDLRQIVEGRRLGMVLIDRTRYSAPEADLSVEPDVVVVLAESLRAGRVRLIPKADGREGRYVEIEGAADLVVECVSDSSLKKDRERLREGYFRAGVREYWLVDARGASPALAIHRPGRRGYIKEKPGPDGFARSEVLGLSVRLERLPPLEGMILYRLVTRAA